MTILRHLVPPECVILELATSEREEAIREMIEHLLETGRITSADCYRFSQVIMERESHTGTGLGSGVAIPHGRVSGLKETVAVFARSKEGIDFESPDNSPSHLICLLLVPEDQAGQHLQMLSSLAKIFSKPQLRNQLEEASTAKEISEILILA